MVNIPGGSLKYRPLNIFWLCDCSGSMSVNGKVEALNNAINLGLKEMKKVANDNPASEIFTQTMRFSHEAKWINPEPRRLADSHWVDLEADDLNQLSADIIFLLDTSGSMADEIEAVKKSCLQFANEIIKRGTDVKLGLIGFDIGGHIGNTRNYEVHDLSTYTIGIWKLALPEKFKENIESLNLGLFGGMGCYLANADSVDIFPYVVMAFNNNFEATSLSQKILVIISDEMGGNEGLKEITKQLKSNFIKTYVVGVKKMSFGSDLGEGAHQTIARETGGKFWDIFETKGNNDFSTLLEEVGITIGTEITKNLSDGSQATGTEMGRAFKLLAEALDIPPMSSHAFPPVMVLVSDGKPTDDYEEGLNELFSKPWGIKSVRIGIGIGNDVDLHCLEKFINNPEIKPLHAGNPQQLIDYIKWASTSVVRNVSMPASYLKKSYSAGFSVPISIYPSENDREIKKEESW